MSEVKSKSQEGDLRIWWIPQVPGKPFHYYVPNVTTAFHICKCLAEYDQFQLENNIKPDYSNAGGLEVFELQVLESGSWCDWYEDGKTFEEALEEYFDNG